MGRVLPRHLEPGDIVRVVSPGSRPDPSLLECGVDALRSLGLVVEVGTHALDRYGHFAGTDQDRAADIMDAFTDARIAGVFCARGGVGCARIVPYLDTNILRANPRVFVGYSDITILHLLIARVAGWPTFYGPMVATELGLGMPDDCMQQLWSVVSKASPAGILRRAALPSPLRPLIPGVAEGVLTGGTLCLIDASIGTPYAARTDGSILVMEDFHEDLWRVDRMLTHLAHAGLLGAAAGFVIGSLIEGGESSRSEGDLPIEQSLLDNLSPTGKPALCRLPFGHIDAPLTIPLGCRARMDTESGTLEVIEAAVAE